MNPTYVLLDVRRMLRTPAILIFAVAMPVGMYMIFGGMQDYRSLPVAHGNVAATIMVSMALYGAATAGGSLGAGAALEQSRGWGRQLSTTPMTPMGYVVNKAMSIQVVTIVPIALVLLTGLLTGARIDGLGWLWCLLLVWLCAIPFTVLGLALALLIRNENAAAINSFLVIALAFLGNVFVPLGGKMLEFARYTPMWGLNVLVRWPVAGGFEATAANQPVPVGAGHAIISAVVWTVVLVVLTGLTSRRGQGR